MSRKKKQKRTGIEAAPGAAGAAVASAPTGSAAAKGPAGSGWIVSPVVDSLLFIGAPLVVMGAFLPMRAFFTSQQIAIFLLAFFTFGHHLPGFMRAYGDRELFARYRTRFLLAPPLIFATALWFDSRNLHGLLIFVAMWDIWHVLMQHYGFMRIYDSKAGAISARTSWLDWGVSIWWYFTLIATSPHYSHNLLSRAYQTGIPLIPPEALQALRTGMTTVAALLTFLYVGYHLDRWRKGKPVSLRKLVMFGIFLSATYYLYVYIDDFLVGFTVWSAFHCIQYYGIVWSFNQNRVAKKSPVTAFLRFLFRPRMGLIVLYMALIFAYGSINYLVSFLTSESLQRILIAFVFTSNALHYYYDGFIWKVREADTRRNLNISTVGEAARKGLAAASASVARAVGQLRPVNRGWLQAAYLAAIIMALAAFETWRPNDPYAMTQSLVALAPDSGEAHYNFGNALWEQGRLDEAVESYRKAQQLMPESSKVYNNLGGVLYDKGMLDEAIENYQRALELHGLDEDRQQPVSNSPLLPGAAASPAASPFTLHANLADALARRGQPEESLKHYHRALAINPRSAKARANLGATLAELGRYEEGRAELQLALQIDPNYAAAHINLASVLAYLGESEQALLHYQRALQSGEERARQAAQAGIAQLQSGL